MAILTELSTTFKDFFMNDDGVTSSKKEIDLFIRGFAAFSLLFLLVVFLLGDWSALTGYGVCFINFLIAAFLARKLK